jgi:hypothetical protein
MTGFRGARKPEGRHYLFFVALVFILSVSSKRFDTAARFRKAAAALC